MAREGRKENDDAAPRIEAPRRQRYREGMDGEGLMAVMATPDEVPAIVDRTRWPVHMTLAGNFVVDRRHELAAQAHIAALSATVGEFEVVLGPVAEFGSRGEVPVLLANHPDLDRLHATLAAGLTQMPGFAATEPDYWCDGYRAHATLGPAVTATAGERMTIRWITLVGLGDRAGRSMAAFRLGASEQAGI